jgi:hypothetical protein
MHLVGGGVVRHIPPCGARPLEALTSRRSQSTRVGHTNRPHGVSSRFHGIAQAPVVNGGRIPRACVLLIPGRRFMQMAIPE